MNVEVSVKITGPVTQAVPPELLNKPVLKIIQGGGFRQIENAVGILKAIEELYPIDKDSEYYWAASAGSPVAALSASNYTAKDIEEIVRNTKAKDLKQVDIWMSIKHLFRIQQGYIYNNKGMYDFLKKYMTARAAERVQVSVTRLSDFKAIMLPATPETVLASTSIPELFPRVKIGDEYYYDGGIKNNCPAPDICTVSDGFCKDYNFVFFILCPFTTVGAYDDNQSMIARLIYLLNEVMDRELNQIYENGWNKLYNCIIIQPPAYPESSLLDWSPDYGLIDFAYRYAKEKLQHDVGLQMMKDAMTAVRSSTPNVFP